MADGGVTTVPAGQVLPDPAHRIARAAVWHWATRYGLGVIVLAAIGLPLALTQATGPSQAISVCALAGGFALLTVAAVGIPLWRYRVHRWEVTESFILTRSGAVFRDWRIVPLHRVQTVEVSQGILERAFGVARLVVRTASYAGSTEVAGLDAATARSVADYLTQALTTNRDDGA